MNKRIRWLDRCKGFATIMVVIGHIAVGYRDAGYYPDHIFTIHSMYYLTYAFHMPLFFILSGYSFALAYCREGRLKKDRVRIQIINLVYLYFFFSAVQWVFKWICSAFVNTNVSLLDLAMMPIKPMDPYWYLYVLIFFYLFILVLCRKNICDNKIILAGAIVVSTIICGIPINETFPIKELLYYFVFFYIGCYLSSTGWVSRFTKMQGICAIVAAVCILTYIYEADRP